LQIHLARNFDAGIVFPQDALPLFGLAWYFLHSSRNSFYTKAKRVIFRQGPNDLQDDDRLAKLFVEQVFDLPLWQQSGAPSAFCQCLSPFIERIVCHTLYLPFAGFFPHRAEILPDRGRQIFGPYLGVSGRTKKGPDRVTAGYEEIVEVLSSRIYCEQRFANEQYYPWIFARRFMVV
jgi:hypothetical protein